MKKYLKKLLLTVLLFTFIFSMGTVSSQAAIPSISTSKYIKTIASGTIYVYTTSSLSKRGTSSPYKAYNAYVSSGDEVYIFSMTSSYAYISYPTTSGRRKGYVKTSSLTANDYSKSAAKSTAQINVYKKIGGAVYGYIAKNDSVYAVARSGNYTQVIYPAGSLYKMGWISNTYYDKYIGGTTTTTTTTYYVTTTAGLILRKSASSSSSKLTTIPYQGAVQVSSFTSSGGTKWAKCTYNGLSGYCSSAYLSTTKPSGTKLSYALYKNTSAYISCGFDGYTTTSGRHEGIDIKYKLNAAVYSLTSGTVLAITRGYSGTNGLSTICVYDSASDKTVVYLHSNPLSSLKVGQTVSVGQQIATEGWRGVSKSSGSHTHVEVREGKKYSAAKSLNDYTLDNSNPTSYWTSKGYIIQ
ncbi:MAG: M23 family metallopeptidase [Clostridiales bacterium]|nr:M23 family metallopeptidase [Clostridiales bacterium]